MAGQATLVDGVAPSVSGELRMNTAGRYQSRRTNSRAFEPLGDQPALQVHTEPRRDSMTINRGAGRRRSIAVTGLHIKVNKLRVSQPEEGSEDSEAPADPKAKLQAVLQGGRQRRSFLETVRPQLNGEQHQQLLQLHGNIVTRSIPPQLTLELYREVTPIMASCVRTYTRSLGSNHKLTAECVERHQECVQRLRQLEMMHSAAEDGADAMAA